MNYEISIMKNATPQYLKVAFFIIHNSLTYCSRNAQYIR